MEKVYSSKWELLVTVRQHRSNVSLLSPDSNIKCLDTTRDRRDFRNNICKFFFFKENIREVKMYLQDAETSPRFHWFSVSAFPLICV